MLVIELFLPLNEFMLIKKNLGFWSLILVSREFYKKVNSHAQRHLDTSNVFLKHINACPTQGPSPRHAVLNSVSRGILKHSAICTVHCLLRSISAFSCAKQVPFYHHLISLVPILTSLIDKLMPSHSPV